MPSKVEQMRDSLLTAIERVKDGSLDPVKAKAMAALAHQVNASLAAELQIRVAAKTQAGLLTMVSEATEAIEAKEIKTGLVERNGSTIRHTMGG